MSERTMLQLIRENEKLKSELEAAMRVVEAARVWADQQTRVKPGSPNSVLWEALLDWVQAQAKEKKG